MRRIALVNQKGGVGKTTSAVNLGAALARLGQRVLLIDLDPQANATVHLGYLPHQLKKTTYSLLCGGAKPADIILNPSANLWLMPANLDLAGAEMELSTAIGREYVLRDALREVVDYDFILVDCPPSLGVLNVNGLVYVDEIFIPLQCEFFAMHGLSLLMRTVDVVKRRLNPLLTVSRVIPTMYDARKSLARETIKEIQTHFKERVTKTRIRSNVRIAEAPSHGKSVLDYAADSNGAEDFMALARELLGIPDPAPVLVPEDPVEERLTPRPSPTDTTVELKAADVIKAVNPPPMPAPPPPPPAQKLPAGVEAVTLVPQTLVAEAPPVAP
jgi:chromosome partitioning protein